MNIKNIRCLLHVAETENISRSARELFIAQPALSRLIADAEKELGYPLFDRVGKKIVLNRNGVIFARHARDILDSWDDLHKELDESNQKPDLSLTVGAEACSQLLPSILQLFRFQQPDAAIQVISAYPLDFTKSDLDYLLKAASSSGKASFAPNEVLLLQEEILLALPQDHPLNIEGEIFYEDTLEYTYVLPSDSTSLGDTLSQYFNENNLTRPPHSTTVNNSFLQCEFVAKGLGISLIPARSWNYVHGNRSLVLKKIKGWDLKRVIWLSFNPSRYQSGLAKAFKQFLIRYFSTMDT
ncbi:LysR family transcriptional regulator [Mediterraneibacter glycyrrhizinilyticus]|uniref:LysR family transcriptional regulator n=1 Tax=Mediterraneibacter glycyrrhizinilyticus TaxID=342942 RepID=UPI00195FF24C|nr:LysR family transcriptional regulator [Mediterraneibacter glycyrrhizinilyticus]MBM6750964.1 LysR family transcriptional regulator [Mediterraneibacter glycyrrhizinilyticus]